MLIYGCDWCPLYPWNLVHCFISSPVSERTCPLCKTYKTMYVLCGRSECPSPSQQVLQLLVTLAVVASLQFLMSPSLCMNLSETLAWSLWDFH